MGRCRWKWEKQPHDLCHFSEPANVCVCRLNKPFREYHDSDTKCTGGKFAWGELLVCRRKQMSSWRSVAWNQSRHRHRSTPKAFQRYERQQIESMRRLQCVPGALYLGFRISNVRLMICHIAHVRRFVWRRSASHETCWVCVHQKNDSQ